MRCQRFAHLGETLAKTDGFHDGNAVPPGEEVPAHLVEAARLESDRERSVVVCLRGLVRVEDEGRGVAGIAAALNRRTTSTGFSWNVPNERFAYRSRSKSGSRSKVSSLMRSSLTLARRQSRGSSRQSLDATRNARLP